MGETARCHPPDKLAAMIDALMRQNACPPAFDPERRQSPLYAARFLPEQGITSNEVAFVERDKTLEPALPGSELRIHVAIHGAERFFEAKRFERIEPDQSEPMRLSGAKQRVQQMPLVTERMIELPAKFAFIVDAQQAHVGGQSDSSRADTEPGKGCIRE